MCCFFAGHSESIENTGHIFINPQESLTLEELKYGLRQAIAQGLQLAIFNSCDGLGLAHALAHLNLPQMIVMRQPVPDRIAQLFLTYLLPAYAAGQPLPLALRQARERLQGVESDFPCASWLPVLYQTTPDAPPSWQQLQQPQTASPPTVLNVSPQARGRSALVASVAAAGLMLVIRALGGLQGWELQAYDRLLQQRLPQTTPERILVIEATEKDINRYGYPLPDQVLAEAIDRLRPYKPRLIGLDIFRDRIEPNSRLQTQLTEQENLVGLCSVRIGPGENQSGIAPPPRVPEARLGFSNVLEDPDGVMRRHLLFMDPDLDDPCATRFSLSAQLAIQYLYADGMTPESLPNEALRLGRAEFSPLAAHAGPYRHLDHWGFQVWLNYAQSESFIQRITLSEVIDEGFFVESLADHIVLIGMSAPVSNPTDYFFDARWRAAVAPSAHSRCDLAGPDGESPTRFCPRGTRPSHHLARVGRNAVDCELGQPRRGDWLALSTTQSGNLIVRNRRARTVWNRMGPAAQRSLGALSASGDRPHSRQWRYPDRSPSVGSTSITSEVTVMKWGINTWWQTVTGLTAIAWSLLTLIALAGAVSYNPPNRGAPGRSSTVRDAGSRGCGLIALEPTLTHWGETLEPQPTFWVFISEADRTVDLTLTHETTDAVLYTATYSAMPAAGISHLPAPADAPPLAPDQPYRWTLSIDCPDESGTNPATTGVVMRRSPDLDLAQALTDAPPRRACRPPRQPRPLVRRPHRTRPPAPRPARRR